MKFMPIGDIINQKISFFIPYYQRGYKWEAHQVKTLLDDFWQFFLKTLEGNNDYKYYCLQPLVIVKINNNLYKVIDGQQRLTTIYIILKVFKDYLEESKNRYRFEINYERDSKELLENIDNINCKNSLDCCYMKEAYNAVFEWIETNSISFQDIEEFRLLIVKNSRISNNKDINKNIRFIWYEIDEKDEFDVFIRLNIGKIPLTNTELIKSFLIQKETDSQKRFDLSTLYRTNF